MVDIEETKIGVHAILVTKDGKIILQQRDEKMGIVNPGLISMFGGTLKKDEDLEDGLLRELSEELGIGVKGEMVKKLGVFFKTIKLDGIDYEINVFVINDIEETNLKVNEGKGYICDDAENLIKNEKLTRITKMSIQKYIEQRSKFN